MAKETLTQGRVSGLICPPGKQNIFLWDSVTQGFGVKVSKGGSRLYVFQDKLDGQDVRITIGAVSAWTLKDASKEARRLHTLFDQGIDPRQQKKERSTAREAKREEDRRQDATVSEAWTAYLEARKAKWSARHLQNHLTLAQAGGVKRKSGRHPGEAETTRPGPLFSFMHRRLAEIDSNAINLNPSVTPIPKPNKADASQETKAVSVWPR